MRPQRRKEAAYTSACVPTRGKASWQYGRIEVRAKIDVRPGLWPAFWTLGTRGRWPACGEVDVMEYYDGVLLANAGPGPTREGVPRRMRCGCR